MFAIRVTMLVVLAGAAVLAAPVVACAQGFGSGGAGSHGFSPPVKGGGVVPNAQLPAPPALPGAAKHGEVAPASKPATDMPPTDALFDAINRGDMGTVQDALSRGADVEGHNVLGMTPLELSVDLGRNDITFLLLSMRGAATDAHAGHAGPALAAAAAPGRTAQAFSASAVAPPVRARLSATVRAVRVQPPAAGSGLAPASVRYAGANPGAPVPSAGFLGFGP